MDDQPSIRASFSEPLKKQFKTADADSDGFLSGDELDAASASSRFSKESQDLFKLARHNIAGISRASHDGGFWDKQWDRQSSTDSTASRGISINDLDAIADHQEYLTQHKDRQPAASDHIVFDVLKELTALKQQSKN